MIVKITGGLGNQMFQYAFKIMLDEKYRSNINYIDLSYFENQKSHNGYELERIFNIDTAHFTKRKIHNTKIVEIALSCLSKIGVKKVKTKSYFKEILIGYYPTVFDQKNQDFYFDGFWQSELYFCEHKKKIRDIFAFPEFTDKKNNEICKIIASCNSVSIHIRRGDFISSSKYICLGNTNYYEQSIKCINKKVVTPFFIVFSDDINWCKEKLNLEENVLYVDWNKGDDSYCDLQLMSLCKHNIIANSTFSWWGAWLNSYCDKIVIAPKKFFNGKIRDESGILPEDWIKMEV